MRLWKKEKKMWKLSARMDFVLWGWKGAFFFLFLFSSQDFNHFNSYFLPWQSFFPLRPKRFSVCFLFFLKQIKFWLSFEIGPKCCRCYLWTCEKVLTRSANRLSSPPPQTVCYISTTLLEGNGCLYLKMCVSERERERERKNQRKRERESKKRLKCSTFHWPEDA